jgi:hypothetical protein
MQAVIIGFHIYHLTGDPLALGLIGLSEAFLLLVLRFMVDM